MTDLDIPTDAAIATTGRITLEWACPARRAPSMTQFFASLRSPTTAAFLMDDPEEASDFSRGEITLSFCPTCGFVSNSALWRGTAEYSQRYEETQGSHPASSTSRRSSPIASVKDYALTDKTVLEIGCGKGEFLVMMAQAGAGHRIGIDPGVHPERIDTEHADGDRTDRRLLQRSSTPTSTPTPPPAYIPWRHPRMSPTS